MKKTFWRVVCVAAAVVCAASLLLLAMNFGSMKRAETKSKQLASEVRVVLDVESTAKVKNPIDFKTLKEKNEDIYAWITIPNTQIDYPIVQSFSESDSFYLNHNIEKNYDINGSVYTEKMNTKTFDDPNTVIYGHNMLDGSMFQNLHKFRQKDFFDKNKYFTIYTENKILKYEIFAAYKYDDRHILNSFDFSDEQVFADYLKTAQAPKSLEVNTREVQLDTSSKIVTLSTCIGNEKSYRYLVQGVLIDATATE